MNGNNEYHLYTAREGGEILKKAVKQAVQNAIADADKAPLARLFSAKHEFPREWHLGS